MNFRMHDSLKRMKIMKQANGVKYYPRAKLTYYANNANYNDINVDTRIYGNVGSRRSYEDPPPQS